MQTDSMGGQVPAQIGWFGGYQNRRGLEILVVIIVIAHASGTIGGILFGTEQI